MSAGAPPTVAGMGLLFKSITTSRAYKITYSITNYNGQKLYVSRTVVVQAMNISVRLDNTNYAQSANIVGDITSHGSVKIGSDSVIRGNIYATSAVIAGAVKGDIDVKGPVILDASAIVMGNIKSKSVQINNGAVIEGLCSQCYAEVSPSSFFRE